jgi:hypothetical protein
MWWLAIAVGAGSPRPDRADRLGAGLIEALAGLVVVWLFTGRRGSQSAEQQPSF